MATKRTNGDSADDTQPDETQPEADVNADAAQTASQIEELQAQLAASQDELRQTKAAAEAQQELLNTQLQLAQAAAGRASMADLASANDSEPAAGWDAAKDGYVVLTNVVTVKVGKDRTASRRFVRGAKVPVIEGVNETQIDRLVQLKALAPNDGRTRRATTARVAAMAAGAAMDEVAQSPIVAYIPTALPTATEAEAAQQASDAALQTEDPPAE